MYFKDSNFEERYNEFWNSGAVYADKQISQFMEKGFGLLQQGEYFSLLTKYAETASTLVTNLNRQTWSIPFDDQDYVSEYIAATLQTMQEDFLRYRSKLAANYGEKSLCVDLIDNSLSNLSQLANHDKVEPNLFM
ncbi:hypothetical protein [Legionella waltersii]|uniref:Bile acid beta-glucosidase n=1 Tax=Legionella waltersii TaxID=66969 RepID=A0A0W1ADL7_9GAMM|nr:hypothetical protein [Legionella waltersii]KTD79433.1 bile acid beta-glucosidase [Legionella waltersii]SNU97680.1 bile acid beta-glucosidase [Legionella waltersii]